jgi:hypothetical protein
MAYIDELFAQMEQLDPEQLLEIQQFIQSQPYKKEGRPPTDAERNAVIRAIEATLANAPTEANTGLQRLAESGFMDDLPDDDF